MLLSGYSFYESQKQWWVVGGGLTFTFCFLRSHGEWWAWTPLPSWSLWKQLSLLTPPPLSYLPSPWHQGTSKGRPHFPGSQWKSTLTGGKITVLSACCDGQRMLCWQEGRSQCDKGKKSACVTFDSLKDPISLTQVGHKHICSCPEGPHLLHGSLYL